MKREVNTKEQELDEPKQNAEDQSETHELRASGEFSAAMKRVRVEETTKFKTR